MSTPMRSAASAASASASSDVSAEPGSCRGPCAACRTVGQATSTASRPRHGTATPPRRARTPTASSRSTTSCCCHPTSAGRWKSLAAIEVQPRRERDGELGGQASAGCSSASERSSSELVGSPTTIRPGHPASGASPIVADIDALQPAFLGGRTAGWDAVQPGRRITTLDASRVEPVGPDGADLAARPPLTRVAPRARRRSEYPRPCLTPYGRWSSTPTAGASNPGPAAGGAVLVTATRPRDKCGSEAGS